MERPLPSRVLIKVSGEGFGGDDPFEAESISYLVEEVGAVQASGVEVALVVGGGNIMRGTQQEIMPRKVADLAGMVGTLINGIALRSALEEAGYEVLLQSALSCERVADFIDPEGAIAALRDGRIVVFAGGTGNPFFTTDSAAALRAGEIDADLVLKGTQVRGVFSADPRLDQGARFLEEISYRELLERELGIIDSTAARICQEEGIPMIIFDLYRPGAMKKSLSGEEIGTLVYPD